MFMGRKIQCHKDVSSLQIDLKIQSKQLKVPTGIFVEFGKVVLMFV